YFPILLLYLCSWRFSLMLLFDLDNLISAENATSLQVGLYTRFSYSSIQNHTKVKVQRHPWRLNPGNPCRSTPIFNANMASIIAGLNRYSAL
ncbi:MAG: hypothetical protein Q7U98_08185, partial [Methylicorpusculum sp.]